MESPAPARPRVAALIIAGAALVSNAYALYRIARQPADLPVRIYEQRYAEVRSLLPARGVVGYVSDLQDSADTERAGLYFYLTQYFLTPCILEWGTDADHVIGDFQQRVPPAGRYAAEGLVLRRAWENGVVLYSRDAP